MSTFSKWNLLLLTQYFSRSNESENVWLRTTRVELDAIGVHLGGTKGLIEAVRNGHEWLPLDRSNSATMAGNLANQRGAAHLPDAYIDPGSLQTDYAGWNAPTYLPHLALWVLASSEENNSGFYNTISTLVDRDFTNVDINKLRQVMFSVWEDLERWSVSETQGRFGSFQVRVLGAHVFVGIPRSQCMMSQKDEIGLHNLFKVCEIQPEHDLTEQSFNRILQFGAEVHTLSVRLRNAMANNEYHKPLFLMISEVLKAWNGVIYETETPRPSGAFVRNVSIDEVGLSLRPSDDVMSWLIQCRFPSSSVSNRCNIVIAGTSGATISCRLERLGDYFRSADQEHQVLLQNALVRSTNEAIEASTSSSEEDEFEVGMGAKSLQISQRQFRIFCWDRFGDYLIERNLPTSGSAYILISPSITNEFRNFLKTESIRHTSMSSKGLPAGWSLICITTVEDLLSTHRQWLSENDFSSTSLVGLRFVGGQSIIQGRTKLYAFYDLPFLELEAPPGTQITTDGLTLHQIEVDLQNQHKSLVKTFRLEVVSKGGVVFRIRARNGDGVANLTLRLSVPEGTVLGENDIFSLDQLGRPSEDSELGVQGIIVRNNQPDLMSETPNDPMELDDGQLPNTMSPDGAIQNTVSAQFLDSLAQVGSMTYGRARDQLYRLAANAAQDIEPTIVLYELRSRGHLEIQTDVRGHTVRIHAVPPALYSLPITQDKLPVFGVSGTLRLQHWVDLFSNSDCMAFIEATYGVKLPVVRLVTIDLQSLINLAVSSGFLTAFEPGDQISSWAGSLASANQSLTSWGWENVLTELHQLQRLTPNSALFKAVKPAHMSVEPKVSQQLFRFDDPTIPKLQVYVLGAINDDGQTRFSFIQDSRWGVWIAIAAFAKMMRLHHGEQEADPWPIHYDESSRSLWLPARLRPPTLIDRALNLCAASAPIVVRVNGQSNKATDKVDLFLDGELIGGVHRVYTEFKSGLWLCYRWVPKSVALKVSSLLGGTLVPLVKANTIQH